MSGGLDNKCGVKGVSLCHICLLYFCIWVIMVQAFLLDIFTWPTKNLFFFFSLVNYQLYILRSDWTENIWPQTNTKLNYSGKQSIKIYVGHRVHLMKRDRYFLPPVQCGHCTVMNIITRDFFSRKTQWVVSLFWTLAVTLCVTLCDHFSFLSRSQLLTVKPPYIISRLFTNLPAFLNWSVCSLCPHASFWWHSTHIN